MAKGFTEDHIAMLRLTLFELFLQVPATVLILAQGGYFSLQVLQTGTCKPVDLCVMSANIRRQKRNMQFTFTIRVPALMLRAMQTIHLAVGTIGACTKAEAVARAIVVKQGC
jgi:hypothetical protein